MARPKAVVFDLGKVLVDFDYAIAARRIAASASVDARTVQQVLDQSTLLFRYETGLMNREEFFQEVREATGFTGGLEVFASYFADVFSPIERMIALHGALRSNGVSTFVFSNTNDIAVEHIRRNFPFFSNFDSYILSYEHRSMKPEPRIYEVVESITGQNNGAILYLDDRIENIETGKLRGWETIHHRTPEESIARVTALGLVRRGSI